MDRNVRVLFFAHPRSGSSSLYQILQSHPELSILEEPFNENFTRWDSANKNYRELIHDIPSLETQVAEIFETHNGVKILDYQLSRDLAVHLLRRPDCKIVFLRRRNLLRSVVSVMIAQQTQLWQKWEMTKPLEEHYRDLQPLDVWEIQQRMAGLKQSLDFLESVVDERPRNEALKLTYEELYFSDTPRQKRQIAAIWKLLRIAPLEWERCQRYLQPETARINSPAVYALLPNARKIEEACGNEVTGRLLDFSTQKERHG
ncbi:MAG: hypothetical protein AB1750_03185 [Chloroflexota bacterium]